ncbi:MAG TPA: hypothetical protein VI755_00500 [Anaerolineales bacterium]|nr:hypothetical protein [Anaerolineales bacterium]
MGNSLTSSEVFVTLIGDLVSVGVKASSVMGIIVTEIVAGAVVTAWMVPTGEIISAGSVLAG